jgi:hypothetical protein
MDEGRRSYRAFFIVPERNKRSVEGATVASLALGLGLVALTSIILIFILAFAKDIVIKRKVSECRINLPQGEAHTPVVLAKARTMQCWALSRSKYWA